MIRAERAAVVLIAAVVLGTLTWAVAAGSPSPHHPRWRCRPSDPVTDLAVFAGGYGYQQSRFVVPEGCVRIKFTTSGFATDLGFFDAIHSRVHALPDETTQGYFKPGTYTFGATLPGHRAGGLEAELVVTARG